MIQITKSLEATDKNWLFEQVDNVLQKRRILWERYSRGIDFQSTGDGTIETPIRDSELPETANKNLQIMLEKFIVDLAAGYSAGKITYNVNVSSDIEKKIGKLFFDRQPVTKEYADELHYIIDTLSALNDDDNEEIELFRQALLYGSAYERVLEDDKHRYKYYDLDALNTVAIWDNKVKPDLLAVVNAYEIKDKDKTTSYYRIYDANKITVYSKDSSEKVDIKIEGEPTKHNWGSVPVSVFESNFSILDRSAAVISSYESLLNNVRNTYKYNDEDCKMKIVGYHAQNPLMINNPDEKTKLAHPKILNPARLEEDEYVLASKTFYVQEGGDADWLTKPINATEVTSMLKYYVDTIFQLSGIPNTADLAFNSGDLNASAIDRKFYIMHIMIAMIKNGVLNLIRRRWTLLLYRLNLKYDTNYTMENVTINIDTNLPSMTDETIDQMAKLNGIISEQTILEKLGYDYETEKKRKEEDINDSVAKTRQVPRQFDEDITNKQDANDRDDEDTSKDDKNIDKNV